MAGGRGGGGQVSGLVRVWGRREIGLGGGVNGSFVKERGGS